ncbi:Glucuronoyl esterase catalytic domain from Hypocrea Jecorina [Desarmillaria tabescens]|uniref:(4-O-methyl)-D-glucuronate--lignin esterase n=1 Tax=Armillaria tabescens TaxID=1929756 RepID=A0AA39MQJ2_ARMTA|nr:Glucuronoyl esterase catalytic domain from Hypocrea Jecorina [Desarmillaria tabescens]KAK0443386.1 Glucuronoyl esterase catalytic domain from Hypocrea Jecorina [Desarmillaria tabescens]
MTIKTSFVASLLFAASAFAQCGNLPSDVSLTPDSMLPDPFTFLNGTAVTTADEFTCRQAEISALFQRFELGELPPRPESVVGTLSGNTLTINVSHGGKSISFNVGIQTPSGSGPFPALIVFGGFLSLPQPSGVAILSFNNDDIAAQNDGSSRGQGKFFTLYGSNHSAGAMMAWAWGVARIMDALEQVNTNINLERVGVTGCSRNGKGALVAGAFEPRIALTIPQESGSGGAGCWRISDSMLANGIDTQTASEIVQENVWFSTAFNTFAQSGVDPLPFDHHMLSGLIAPRPLLIIDNTGIDWLGPESVWGCQKTANLVWQGLGVGDFMGVSQVGNHAHCAFPSQEQPDLNAFVNRFLKDQNADTNIIKTDGANGLGFVDSQWIDWEVPDLS